MKPAGRPLRFLVALLGVWVCVRGATFIVPAWLADESDVAEVASLDADLRPLKAGEGAPSTAPQSVQREAFPAPAPHGARQAGISHVANVPPNMAALVWAGQLGGGRAHDTASDTTHVTAPDITPDIAPQTRASERPEPYTALSPFLPPRKKANRWSTQAWMLWRPDGEGGAARAPLLGGSQAGARIDYRLGQTDAGSFNLYARASRALSGASAEEVAAGLFWRPGAVPFSVLVERREGFGTGGRSGFAVMVAGGLNPVIMAPRVEAEGYAQAGFVGAPGRDGFAEGFADGKMSLAYRATQIADRGQLMLGVTASASVQPGARRIDIGPEVRLQAPAGWGNMRFSAEWRTRIAGNARPASGPAVTLMTDF